MAAAPTPRIYSPSSEPQAAPSGARAPQELWELHPLLWVPAWGGDTLAGVAPSPRRQTERLAASQPDGQTGREPTLPTLLAPNPPMQSLGAPRARQAGGSQGFVGFCSPSRDPRLRPQRPGKKPVEKKPSTAVLGAGRAQGFGEGQSLRSQDKWHPLRNRSSPGLSPLLSSFSRRPELRLFHLRCRGSSWQAGALQAPPRSAETRAAPEQFLKLRGQGAAATLP